RTLAGQSRHLLDQQNVPGWDVTGLHHVQEVAELPPLAVGAVKAREAAVRAERGEPVAVPFAPCLGVLDLAMFTVAKGLLGKAAEPGVTVNGGGIHGCLGWGWFLIPYCIGGNQGNQYRRGASPRNVCYGPASSWRHGGRISQKRNTVIAQPSTQAVAAIRMIP